MYKQVGCVELIYNFKDHYSLITPLTEVSNGEQMNKSILYYLRYTHFQQCLSARSYPFKLHIIGLSIKYPRVRKYKLIICETFNL